MKVEIGILNKEGEFQLRAIEESYAGQLTVLWYRNKVTNKPDPLIKRADGQSFVHLSTLKERGYVARIVGDGAMLTPNTAIDELAMGEQR